MAKEGEKEKEFKKTNWRTTESRFVAFIDILGFKDKVMRKSHDSIYQELAKISAIKDKVVTAAENNPNEEYFKDADIYIVSFSDSVVIFSKNDSYENFEFFLIATRFLFAKAIDDNIPLKGAIAHGEISLNKSEQIYFGQAIIDAYLLEEQVNYLGVVCHDSIDSYILKHKSLVEESKIMGGLIVELKTPLKSGQLVHKNLDWFLLNVEFENLESENAKNDICEKIKHFYTSVSGSPRNYIDNTIEFITKGMETNKINLKDISLE